MGELSALIVRMVVRLCTLMLLVSLLSISYAWIGLTSRGISRRGVKWSHPMSDSDDAPSDMDSSMEAEFDAITLESPPKSFLLKDAKSLSRIEMNEYVLALEKVNPTEHPANCSMGYVKSFQQGLETPPCLDSKLLKLHRS